MILAARLAWRDLRRGARGLWLLAACLFLGIASLAGIGSLSASMLAALDAQDRSALGGDLELRVSQRLATIDEQAAFAAAGRVSEIVRLSAMASRRGPSTPALVEIKSVDAAYPLVGRLRLLRGASSARPGPMEAAIAPALADRLGVQLGHRIRIGAASLIVMGLIANEPDQLGDGFALGPSVLLDRATLAATDLLQPGSLYEARYRILLRPGADAQAAANTLLRRFPGAGWTVRLPRQATGTLRRAIDQLGQFLLLVGLAALTIAGVGIGSGVSAYLGARTRAIATLKVLGARSGLVSALFLIEIGLVAMLSALAGVAVGASMPALVRVLAGSALPIAPRLAFYPRPLAVAVALGFGIALLCALPALARASRVPAASLLRDALAASATWSPPLLLAMTALTAAILSLTISTASQPWLAGEFVAAAALLIALLWLIGLGLRALLGRWPRPRRPLLRLALANLHRPGAQTDRLIVALGLGFSLFVALAAINGSLSAELANAAPARAPRFFAIDLPADDGGTFRQAVLSAAPAARIEAVPSLRGAIVAIKSVPVADLKHLSNDAWVLSGDRTITWSAVVPPRNRVVAGRWWPRDYRGPPLVSIEDRAAHALGLRIGDRITISVLGVDVEARVAALRQIDWGGLGLNFAIVFSPGLIEEAPHSLLASVYAPADRDGAIARTVGARLPGVTMIRVGDVIAQIGDALGQMAFAIRVAAAVTVVAGIAVLIGAVAAAARARAYDVVILKLLGASRAQVLTMQAAEYLLLSIILALLSLAVGAGGGWYVVVEVFQLPWAPGWGSVLLTLAASMSVTVAIGILGNIPVLATRPAQSLRAA